MATKQKKTYESLLVPVKSSNISAIGYDELINNLYIKFKKTGKVYCYNSVPPALHEQLMKAESKGKFLNANIVAAKFSYEVIE